MLMNFLLVKQLNLKLNIHNTHRKFVGSYSIFIFEQRVNPNLSSIVGSFFMPGISLP